jgi:branched-chain amino acid transport system permease protein
LTLLIINAFAAAIIGRLRSLPLTYVGALLIGLVVYFAVTFLNFTGRFSALQPNYVFPIALLFVALLVLPQARIELRRLPPKGRQPRVRTVWETALGMALVFAVVWFITRSMDQVNLNRVTLAMVTSILMLSLVPLTGWAGQVSLAQITFAGAGAFAMYEWGSGGSPFGLVMAAIVAALFGMLMALPALRLQGLYLALASMAFAVMAESLFFGQPEVFGNGAQKVSRLSVFGYHFTDQRAYLFLATGVFGAMAVFVVWLRRSRYGRRLIALRDSEAACATLGVNRLTSKLSVYALSAGMAGFAGAFLGMQRGTAATQDYVMLAGIPIVLLVVVGGVETVSGALLGGVLFEGFVWIQESFEPSWFTVIERVQFGLIAVAIALTVDRIRREARVTSPAAALRGRATTLVVLVAAVPVVVVLTSFLKGNFDSSWLQALTRLGPGFLALSVALRPNGSSVELGFVLAPLLPWRREARAEFMAELRSRLGYGAPPPTTGPPTEPVAKAPVPAGVAAGAEPDDAASVRADEPKGAT